MSGEALRGGMRGFLIVWVGQVVSLLGTSMTNFGLTIWAFEATGQATSLALIGACYTGAMLLVSPFGGVIVDRYDRKRVMMASDAVSGLASCVILGLLLGDSLAIWHIYVIAIVLGAFQSVQWPASSAVITLMLPRSQYTRANSLMGLAEPSSQIIAPLLAGALLGVIGLRGILLIDVVTFVFAVSALAFVVVPRSAGHASGALTPRGALAEAAFGFRYIWQRPNLLALQTVFLIGNFLFTVPYTLLPVLILLRTGNDALALGSAQTLGAVGGVVGGVLVGLWGGFRRRIVGVLFGWGVSMGAASLVGLGHNVLTWGAALFVIFACSSLINASNQAIWQSKVPPALQGRVFSIRQMIAMGIAPLAALIAGPLADRVLEPGMRAGGGLAGVFGGLVGTQPGAGIALAFLVCGGLGVLLALGASLTPLVRQVEVALPDHEPPRRAEALPGD